MFFSTEERVVHPKMTLLPVWAESPENSTVRLLCTLSDFFPDTLSFQWQKDGRVISDVEATHRKFESVGAESKTFSLSSEIQPNMSDWKKGSIFTCNSTHKGQEFIESASVCKAHGGMSPSVRVHIPSFRTVMMGNSIVTATCLVQTIFAISVTWMMDDKHPTSSQVSQISNTSYVISRLDVSTDAWKVLKQLKCRAEHPCFPGTEESISVAGAAAAAAPSVEIRRSLSEFLKGEAAVLECAVYGLSSIDSYIYFKANKLDISDKQFVDLPKSQSLHSITRRFKIPQKHWVRNTTFSCVLHQGFSASFSSEPTGRLFEDPSMELILVPSGDLGSQRLFCIGQGFNPHIKWLEQEKTPSSFDSSIGSDGRLKVTSELYITKTEWESGESFTCEVADKSLSKTVKSTISICSAMPPSRQHVGVYVWGPSLLEHKNKGPITVTCLLTGFDLDGFSITWKIDGSEQTMNSYLEPLVKHRNGTETRQSFLNVSSLDWDTYKLVSCKAKHICSINGHEEYISKSKDLSSPTVVIIPPSPSEHADFIPLVCQVSQFFPADILVYWEKDDGRCPPNAFTNSPAWRYTGGEEYTVISRMNVSRAEDRASTYSCVARHDSSRTPFQNSIKDIFASVSHTKPTVALLVGSGELVCLVFGFSPASINFTWMFDGNKELLDFNTSKPSRGLDGKYSIQSWLRLSPSHWLPGVVHTCMVEHVTGTSILNVSRPAIMQDCDFMDGLVNVVVSQDLGGEAWYTSLAFLILFILSIIYAASATLIKVRHQSSVNC